LVFVLTALYIFKTLLFGGRVEILQVSVLLFVLLENRKTKWATLVPLFLAAFCVFLLIGIIRSDPLSFFNGNSIVEFEPSTLFRAFDNQNDIYYSSARIIGMLETGIITFVNRIQILFYTFAAIFVPFSFLPEIANLAAFKKDIYPAGGGGLISTYFYTYFSYVGPIFIGFVISQIVNLTIKNRNLYFLVYGFLVLSTYFRWFGYSPIILFKLCIYGVVFLKLMTIANKLKIKF
jgi:hypothetical protein